MCDRSAEGLQTLLRCVIQCRHLGKFMAYRFEKEPVVRDDFRNNMILMLICMSSFLTVQGTLPPLIICSTGVCESAIRVLCLHDLRN